MGVLLRRCLSISFINPASLRSFYAFDRESPSGTVVVVVAKSVNLVISSHTKRDVHTGSIAFVTKQ